MKREGGEIPDEAMAALVQLYVELARETEGLDLSCRGCGLCCHFDEMEHILFATGLEAEFFLRSIAAAAIPALFPPPQRCPYQDQKACRAHAMRPLGCRLHFCRNRNGAPLTRTERTALEDLAAGYHERLQRIHETWQIPWVYTPFLEELTSRSHLPPLPE